MIGGAPHLRAVDGAEVAEIIVHESIHPFIYVIEEWYPLIPDRARAAEVKATSTWSGRALALHAFVHACFVWFGTRQFWRLAGREGVFPGEHARARGDTIAAGFADPALAASFEGVADHFAPEVRAALRRVIHGVPRGAFDG